MGNIKAENKKFNEAIELYKTCYDLNPNYCPCIINMEMLFRDRILKTLFHAKQAHNIDPNNFQASYNLGFFIIGKLNKAMNFYKNAIK